MSETIYIEWDSPTHHHKPKELGWYQYVIYGGVALFIISLFLQSILFSFLIILSVVVLFIVGHKPPEECRYALTSRGIRCGNTLYPHNVLRAYSVNEHETFPHLVLQSEKTFSPFIIIPLGDTDWGLVREYFKEHRIREVPHEETFLDRVAERIGF